MRTLRLLGPLSFAVFSLACSSASPSSDADVDVGTTDQAITLRPPSGTKQVAISEWNACAVSYGGAAKCWGVDNYGQLGIGYSLPVGTDKGPSTPWGMDTGVVQIGVGMFFACALKTDGNVYCWGRDFQEADLSTNYVLPQQVAGIGGIKEIVTGDSHACVRDSANLVACWGGNSKHQVSGSNASLVTPTYQYLANVKQLALGTDFSCALIDDGTVKCWGGNDYGQLGTGDVLTRAAPTTLPNLANVTQLAVHGFHGCARISDGSVKCWGLMDPYGPQGVPTTPQTIAGLSGVVRVGAGTWHNCAIQSGATRCWGKGTDGQLGDGAFANHASPTPIATITDAWFAAGGGENTCVIRGSTPAQLHCFGFGGAHVNADGTYSDVGVPTLATELTW